MTPFEWSPEEQALADVFAALPVPTAAVRARLGGAAAATHGADRRRHRRPQHLLAAAVFAATVVALGVVVGGRGLHGASRQDGGLGGGATTPASPSPRAFVPPTCRLPVVDDTTHQARLVQLPAGTDAGGPPVQAQGDRYDGRPITWDAPLGRWVRSSPELLSPDGRMWLYRAGGTPPGPGPLHLADASGGDRVITLPGLDGQSQAPAVVGWLPQGILYAVQAPRYDSYRWFDPATGAVRDADVPLGFWRWFGGTALWDLQYGAGDQVLRSYDLSSHAVTTWFSENAFLGPLPPQTHSMSSMGPVHTLAEQARGIQLVTVDVLGHPVLHLGSRDTGVQVSTLYLDRPGHVVVVDAGVRPHEQLDLAAGMADAHGVWFTDYAGRVFLYEPGDRLRQVADLAAGPTSLLLPVGPCG